MDQIQEITESKFESEHFVFETETQSFVTVLSNIVMMYIQYELLKG